ncbi:unnamed protein product [Ectocarpus fasciculatus]
MCDTSDRNRSPLLCFWGDFFTLASLGGTALIVILRYFLYCRDGHQDETYGDFIARMEATFAFRDSMQKPEFRARMEAAIEAKNQAETRWNVNAESATRAVAGVTEAGAQVRAAMGPASDPNDERVDAEALAAATARWNDAIKAAAEVKVEMVAAHLALTLANRSLIEVYAAGAGQRATDYALVGSSTVRSTTRGTTRATRRETRVGRPMEPMEIGRSDTLEEGRRSL